MLHCDCGRTFQADAEQEGVTKLDIRVGQITKVPTRPVRHYPSSPCTCRYSDGTPQTSRCSMGQSIHAVSGCSPSRGYPKRRRVHSSIAGLAETRAVQKRPLAHLSCRSLVPEQLMKQHSRSGTTRMPRSCFARRSTLARRSAHLNCTHGWNTVPCVGTVDRACRDSSSRVPSRVAAVLLGHSTCRRQGKSPQGYGSTIRWSKCKVSHR